MRHIDIAYLTFQTRVRGRSPYQTFMKDLRPNIQISRQSPSVEPQPILGSCDPTIGWLLCGALMKEALKNANLWPSIYNRRGHPCFWDLYIATVCKRLKFWSGPQIAYYLGSLWWCGCLHLSKDLSLARKFANFWPLQVWPRQCHTWCKASKIRDLEIEQDCGEDHTRLGSKLFTECLFTFTFVDPKAILMDYLFIFLASHSCLFSYYPFSRIEKLLAGGWCFGGSHKLGGGFKAQEGSLDRCFKARHEARSFGKHQGRCSDCRQCQWTKHVVGQLSKLSTRY